MVSAFIFLHFMHYLYGHLYRMSDNVRYINQTKQCTIGNVMSPWTLRSNSSAKNVIQRQKIIVRQNLMNVMITFQHLWNKYNVSISYISL